MSGVQIFSKGKVEMRNEDYFLYDRDSFVIVDGATDKSGRLYDGRTGGEIISEKVAHEALSSSLNGEELVAFLNQKVSEIYCKLGISNDVIDPKYRFSCGCIVVRRAGDDMLLITYIGDLGFRINGESVYQEVKQIDLENSEKRAAYIRETGDIEGSRSYIMTSLLNQFEYQNNPSHIYGYGVIDGTTTPTMFVKTFEYALKQVHTIELFSDGYFSIPQGTAISDWEAEFSKVETEDPDKWKKYKSTKSKDDRTIAIITF